MTKIRRAVTGVVGLALVVMLAACGSAGAAANPIVSNCRHLFYSNVTWSPDGKYIGFMAADLGGPEQIYVMNPDGTGMRQLVNSTQSLEHLYWLGDSQSLAYSTWVPGESKINLVGLDGVSTMIRVRQSFDDFQFSPDGKTIAYPGYELGKNDRRRTIELITAGGPGLRVLRENEPAFEDWSPDSARIAYITYTNDGWASLFTMKQDGTDAHKLADGDGPARWSPDGQWIAFISTQDNYSLHVVRADGTGEKRIVQNMDHTGWINWLPDSQHISYLSRPPDMWFQVVNIDTLEVETFKSIRVSTNDEVGPSWSPDGDRVAFTSYEDAPPGRDFSEIYVASRDGTYQTRITDNPGRYLCFDWPF